MLRSLLLSDSSGHASLPFPYPRLPHAGRQMPAGCAAGGSLPGLIICG